jgi:Uma2 family endonuclease
MATTKTRITADEYHKLPETTQPMELIDGEIIVSPAPLDYHQEISLNITRLLLGITLSKGYIRFSPVDVQLDEHNIVQPDVMWVSGPDSLCQRDSEGKRWYGGPDLVCEILSPGTAKRDEQAKFVLYEKYGVREYWLLDPANQWVEVYSRQDDKLILIDVYHQTTFPSPLLQQPVNTTDLFTMQP